VETATCTVKEEIQETEVNKTVNHTKIKVPRKYQPMIREIYRDEDGYWLYTAKGYYASGTDLECHVIHADTQNEILEGIRQIIPCSCNQCKKV